MCVYVRMVKRSVTSYLLQLHGLWPSRFLCPSDFLGKNTEVGCHFLLRGIFLNQGLKPSLLCLLHWQEYSLPLHHLGVPIEVELIYNIVFVSGLQDSDSVTHTLTHTYIYSFSDCFPYGYYKGIYIIILKTLHTLPCAVWWVLVGYLFYI